MLHREHAPKQPDLSNPIVFVLMNLERRAHSMRTRLELPYARAPMSDDRSSIESYARAAARMADPFSSRAEVLASMNLDEAGWATLDGQWRAEIQRRSAAGDRRMAEIFAAAFAAERERLARLRAHAEPPPAASVRGAHDIDTTGAAHVKLEPALPFAGSREPPPRARFPIADETAEAKKSALDSTAILEENDPLGKTLPFQKDR